jgi:phage-related protein
LSAAYRSSIRDASKALFEADANAKSLKFSLGDLGANLGKVSLGLGGIGAAGAAVSALVPVAAVASGGILALGSSVASVGAGFGLFAVVAKGVFSDISSETSAYQASLVDTGKKRATDIATYQAQLKSLTGPQKELAQSVNSLQSDWHGAISDMSGIVVSTLLPVLNVIPDVLNTVESMMQTMAPAFAAAGQSIAKALDGKAFYEFMTTLATHAATDIPKVIDIFGHLADIAGKVIVAFSPLGDKILSVIDTLTQKADAGANNTLSRFIDYIDANGPNVMKSLANIASAFKSMGGALASEGQVAALILPPLTGLLKLIASNPIGADALAGLLVLTKLGAAPAVLGLISSGLTKIVGGVKDWMIAQEALTIVNKEGAIASILAWGLVGVAILAIGAIIFLIIKYHTQLWDAAKAVWAGIKSAAEAVWNWLDSTAKSVFGWMKANWPLLLGILTGPIGLAVGEIVQHWSTIKNGALDVVHSITSWFSALPGQMLSIGENIVHGLINGILGMAGQIWSTVQNLATNYIEAPFKAALSIFSPSRVFAAHGQNIVAGLVSGIDSSAHLATASVTRMASGVANAGTASINRSMAGAAGSQQIVVSFDGSGADSELMTALKKLIRVHGGNPGILGR